VFLVSASESRTKEYAMSDAPAFTLTVTRSQLIRAMLDVQSDVDFDHPDQGVAYAVDVLLHSLDPAQFADPHDAPPAIADGPTGFQPAYPGSPQYYRDDAPGFVLLHDRVAGVVKVHGPTDSPSGSLLSRPVVHSVTVLDGDVDDAIAAASAAVDHMMGRGR
jgi:hypothetical protein